MINETPIVPHYQSSITRATKPTKNIRLIVDIAFLIFFITMTSRILWQWGNEAGQYKNALMACENNAIDNDWKWYYKHAKTLDAIYWAYEYSTDTINGRLFKSQGEQYLIPLYEQAEVIFEENEIPRPPNKPIL